MRRRLGAALIGAALVASGCQPGPPAPTPPAPTASAPTASATPTPTRPTDAIAWQPCLLGECGTLRVPLRHERPDAGSIELAVARVRASASPRLGTLFVNPGGPGIPGRMLARLASEIDGLEQWDVVAWDTRGVGASTALTCLNAAEEETYLTTDFSPDTPAERDALLAQERLLGQACRDRSADGLAASVSTRDSARDLDLLRAAVGESKLTYAGLSAGASLGAAYATLFPARVGRLVLDAPPDPEDAMSEAPLEAELDRFAAWCAPRRCLPGTTPDSVKTGLTAWLRRLDTHPLRVGDRTLTQGLAAWGVAGGLVPGSGAREQLATTLKAAMTGEGTALLASADGMLGRNRNGHSIFTTATAIACLDAPRLSVDATLTAWGAARRRAPFFASFLGPQLACAVWPDPPRPLAPLASDAGAGILVIGGREDAVTGYAAAPRLASRLRGSALLTREGAGHGSVGRGNACVDAAVASWLSDPHPTLAAPTCP